MGGAHALTSRAMEDWSFITTITDLPAKDLMIEKNHLV